MDFCINLPNEVSFILNILISNGFEAYIVGGCVRDSIIGTTPGDWDITTNALSDKVKSLFEKTVDTGIKHGTVTVMVDGVSFEVTTYRTDGIYEDNRRPVGVRFTSSIEADLSRRDFTMNAIAYHPITGFIDPFGGIADIKSKLIRTVGNADERFKEDALRMLRAVRFSCRLNFSIHDDIFKSIFNNSSLICYISRERVRDELTGILTSDYPLKFILLRDTGILQFILPEFEACAAVHSLHAVESIENDACLRWTMLLHEKSALMASIILNRLRFDKRSIKKIRRLITHHDRDIGLDHKAVRKAAAVVGDDLFEDLLKVKEADKIAQNPEYREHGLAEIYRIRQIYCEIKEDGQCLDVKSLAVNGNDLLGLGFPKSGKIGEALNKLLDMVIDEPGLNRKDTLLKLADGMLHDIGNNNA